uniref:Uncharacterized protein n=1 Tax=Daphnia magna TaxID=35525 RepID=A0A0P5LNA2_9CRUS
MSSLVIICRNKLIIFRPFFSIQIWNHVLQCVCFIQMSLKNKTSTSKNSLKRTLKKKTKTKKHQLRKIAQRLKKLTSSGGERYIIQTCSLSDAIITRTP